MRKFIMLLFVLALGVNMTALATNDNDGGGNDGLKVELNAGKVELNNAISVEQKTDLSFAFEKSIEFNVEQVAVKVEKVQRQCSDWEQTGNITINWLTGQQVMQWRRLCCSGAPTMWCDWEYENRPLND